jgi:hypothetical protein
MFTLIAAAAALALGLKFAAEDRPGFRESTRLS